MAHHHGYHENLISLILKATRNAAPAGHWLGQTKKKYYLKKYYLKKF